MTSRHALLPAVTAAVVLALALVLPFAGCGLPLGGLPGDQDGGSPCNTDGQCDDKNPCTIDACGAGTCSHLGEADGPALSGQIAFDCQVLDCVKGQPVIHDDDADIPIDAEQCTFDTCNAGVASHTAKPDDTPCMMSGDGRCDGGKCKVICTSDTMCNDDNACTQDACDLVQGVCAFTPLNGVDTPGAVQKAGDCRIQICVDGVSTDSIDDSDLPLTATDCDEETCTNGTPANDFLADTVTCGVNKDRICDGAGTCVECNLPTQCPGIDNDCQARTCLAHACAISFSPSGTPRAAPFQTTGDCKVIVCDGAGSSAPPVIDDADKPVDGNLCTKDLCNGGVPTNPVEPVNTACGNNSACNAVGQCGCANDAACLPLPNTCGGGNPGVPFFCGCTPKSCGTLGKTCGTVTDGCFATQNCNTNSKDGTETDVDCGGSSATCGTTCAAGKQCNVDSDCGSGHCADGVCCNTACTGTCLACTNAKKGGGADGTCGSIAKGLQDPNATMTCVGTNVCDGANNCKKLDGQICSLNSECVNGSCADGVCCNTTCNGTCLACSAAKKGGGADGVCGNIPINQPDNAATATCTGTSSCDGNGVCKKNVGQACTLGSQCVNGNCVDGVCCGSASCGACQSCNLATPGTCTNIASGNQDNNPVATCTGSSQCDGNGVCKKVNGQVCSAGPECLNGNCVDNICCAGACTGTCKACNIAGSLGVCTNLASGATDSNAAMTCQAPSACDGGGICKKNDGQGCGINSDCLNGNCIDNICCNSTCTATCKACNVAGSLGVCTNLASGATDSNAATTCLAPSVCDGSAGCKLNDGQMCNSDPECLHGNCIDGVCCNQGCLGTCQSCNVAGSVGTCTNTPSGMTDDNATTVCSGISVCDGNGNGVNSCKLKNGQGCTIPTASTCLSGKCADSVCCNTLCDATNECMSCDGTTPGTCSAVKSADDIDSCLPLTSTCSATGTCGLKPGQPCLGMPANCASGTCSGGNCD